jgi:hypothetical protein
MPTRSPPGRGKGWVLRLKTTIMAINNAKHIIVEIDGVRCTIVETGCTFERAAFLNDILSYNNLEVKEVKEVSDNQGEEPRYTLGVTDIIFNPVFAVYEQQLKTREGNIITPGYWKQETTDFDQRYWIKKKNAKKAVND